MRRLTPELEKLIPRLSPTHFTKEKSARALELDSSSQIGMLELHDEWNLIGWALADEVAPREMCTYVIMCERDGFQAWCHIAWTSLELMIEKVTEDPARIVSLR